jgi:hypothetical protein
VARIRSLKPELLEDEKTGALPHDTWRLFVSTLLLADDYGNFRASPLLVHGSVFWAHPGAETARMLRELGEAGLLSYYTVAGQRYAHVNGWAKHQKVDHPSAPLCPGPDLADQTPNGATVGARATDSRESRETLAPDRDRDQDLTRTRITECGEPAQKPASPPPVLSFPVTGGKGTEAGTWGLGQDLVDDLQGLFPEQDVVAGCRAALAWVKANMSRRKTAGGMRKFLTDWLARAQNRGENLRKRQPGQVGGGGSRATSNGLAAYCEWHLENGGASPRPKSTCPECRKCGSAAAGVR